MSRKYKFYEKDGVYFERFTTFSRHELQTRASRGENMPNAADNAKSMMENEMDNSPIKNAYNAVLRVWNQRNVKEKMRSANSQTMSSNKTQKDVKPNTSFHNKADKRDYYKSEYGIYHEEQGLGRSTDTIDRFKD